MEDKNDFYTSLADSIHEKYLSSNFEINCNDFEILSTIRYDPKLTSVSPIVPADIIKDNFFLFEEHYNRLIFTLQYFQAQINNQKELEFELGEDLLLSKIIEAVTKSDQFVFVPLKIRLLVSLNGNVLIEVMPTPVRENLLDGLQDIYVHSEDTWDVYIDKELTLISPFTSFKTTRRDHYNQSRNRALPGVRPGKEEVLLINSSGHIMEGSITNVAIKRKKDGKWITPQLSSGCLCGVMRHFLLRKGFIEEETISLECADNDTEVLLFNGIMGVVRGRIVG